MESTDVRDAVNREPESGAVASRDRMPGDGELARVLLHSSEVAIHIGYTRRGWRGGLVTGRVRTGTGSTRASGSRFGR